MDGYLNFYAITPSPFKNQLLLRKRLLNHEMQLSSAGHDAVYFPIRGMDFNPETLVLYTGDEAGYLQCWNLEPLLEKLKQNEEIHKKEQERQRGQSDPSSGVNARTSPSLSNQGNAFLTGVPGGEILTELPYDLEADVIGSYPCKAHEDAINCVTYIPELKHVTTCAFDYHVFVWNAEGIKPTKPYEKPNRPLP